MAFPEICKRPAGLHIRDKSQFQAPSVQLRMTVAAKSCEIGFVSGLIEVVPDRLHVMSLKPLIAAADDATIAVALMDALRVFPRPTTNVGAFGRDAPLPEIAV